MSRAILLATAALTCAGCVPFPAYDSPAVTGSVRDRASSVAIPGAQISVTPLKKPNLVSAATANAEGHFRVEEIKHRVWALPLPFDPIYPNATVTVSAAGYRPVETTSYKLMESSTVYLDHQ